MKEGSIKFGESLPLPPSHASSAQPDWEKEAKKRVRIEMEDPATRRRKTIYDLESYASYAPVDSSMGEMLRYSIMGAPEEPSRRIRYSVSMVNIPLV